MVLLLSQTDSYLKESSNRVISCVKVENTEIYRVVLDNTVLYPEGGGQPSDSGTVDGHEVISLAKSDTSDSHVIVELAHPLVEGSEVKSIVQCNSIPRRYSDEFALWSNLLACI